MALLRRSIPSHQSNFPMSSSISKKQLRYSPLSHSRRVFQQKKKQQQRKQQHHQSAPTSPQSHSTAAPMEITVEQENQEEEKKQSDVELQQKEQQQEAQQEQEQQSETLPPASTSTSAPTYTPAEQKMIDTINNVAQRIETIATRELSMVTAQIRNYCTKLCLFKWHPYSSFTFDAEKLNRAHKTLYYQAGMVDENTMAQIFRLDSIMTENDSIRKLRKSTIVLGNENIKSSLALRKKLDIWKRWVPEWKPVEEDKKQPEAVTESSTAMEDIEVTREEQAMKDDEEIIDEEEKKEEIQEEMKSQLKQKSSPQLPTRHSSPQTQSHQPSQISPFHEKYSHLNLPTYAGPQFHAQVHPRTGALVVSADMSGISSDDISVTPDSRTRTITIQGVRLPVRRHSYNHPFGNFFGMPMHHQPVQPHGYFKKVIQLEQIDPHEILDLSQLDARIDSQNELQIVVPRKPEPQPQQPAPKRVPQPQPQPQRRRAPVQHQSGWYDDEDDGYGYGYGPSPFFAQPQPTYRRPMNPFFGW